jgi:hypothetical protein
MPRAWQGMPCNDNPFDNFQNGFQGWALRGRKVGKSEIIVRCDVGRIRPRVERQLTDALALEARDL